MKLDDLQESDNVEDRRGVSGGGVVVGGVGVLVLALVVMLLGGDPTKLLQSVATGDSRPVASSTRGTAVDQKQVQFVKKILWSTEDVWASEFRKLGSRYENTKVELYADQTRSGCGAANAQMGPFYCPADRCVYLDLSFFQELQDRFGVKGDFPRAYVIAHEVGHHVQDLLGISAKVEQARRHASEAQANALSVRLELQADFYAGYWAQKAQAKFSFLDPGDIEAAVQAASAIGDDTLQKQARGYAVPDSFTHGTSSQRVKWFLKGFKSSDFREGDTFRVKDL